MLDNLKDYTIILASQSPRRQDLLKMAHVDFEVVVVPDVPEDFPAIMPVEDVPEYLASQKQKAYAHIWSKPQTLVITADTIVELKGRCLISRLADRRPFKCCNNFPEPGTVY